MKYLVLFSGGLDSTYLVYNLLKEGHEVELLYIEILNNKNKSIIEKAQRKLLIKQFKSEFPGKVKYSSAGIKIEVTGYNDNYESAQPHLWTTAAALCYSNDVDRVAIGYVMNDSSLSYLPEIKRLFNAHGALLRKDMPKMPKIEFPLIKYHKEELIEMLPDKYLNLTFYCEEPHIIKEESTKLTYKICDNCPPCKTAKGLNRGYHKAIKKQLNKKTGKITVIGNLEVDDQDLMPCKQMADTLDEETPISFPLEEETFEEIEMDQSDDKEITLEEEKVSE